MSKEAESINKIEPIVLDTPIKRGEGEITEVYLRKPGSGELRGCTLIEVLQMDVVTLQRLLPRITNPALTEKEVGYMDPADLLNLGMEVAGFLTTKASRPEAYLPK